MFIFQQRNHLEVAFEGHPSDQSHIKSERVVLFCIQRAISMIRYKCNEIITR